MDRTPRRVHFLKCHVLTFRPCVPRTALSAVKVAAEASPRARCLCTHTAMQCATRSRRGHADSTAQTARGSGLPSTGKRLPLQRLRPLQRWQRTSPPSRSQRRSPRRPLPLSSRPRSS